MTFIKKYGIILYIKFLYAAMELYLPIVGVYVTHSGLPHFLYYSFLLEWGCRDFYIIAKPKAEQYIKVPLFSVN